MLSVPTLWTVFVINFLALGLIWAYVMRSYPAFAAARFWTGSTFAAAGGGALAMLRVATDSIVPLIAAGPMMVLAACLAAMGVHRFFGREAAWRASLALAAFTLAALVFFTFVHDSAPIRIAIYTVAQSLPLIVSARLLLAPHGDEVNQGARLAGIVAVIIVAIYAFRLVAAFVSIGGGGEFSFMRFDALQSTLILALVFLSMALNFGFLLMAMDRLRTEVADLALLDDLTGVGNRRHLVHRLTEECARSARSAVPFALLVIDLDGFKAINDTHGHAAGDACLRHFTLMAQTRLRPGDMLARSGGDEFCIVLPTSSVREGGIIARRIVDVCRADAAQCSGADIPIAVSIGVAQWSPEMGANPDRLIAAADRALYDAKKRGRDGYALYDPAPPLAPELPASPEAAAGECA